MSSHYKKSIGFLNYTDNSKHYICFFVAKSKPFSDFWGIIKPSEVNSRRKKKKPSFFKKLIIIVVVGSTVFIGLKVYNLYKGIKQPNVNLNTDKPAYIYIPTGAGYKDVINILYTNNLIVNRSSFEWVAEKKNYANNVKPGKYKISPNLSNNALINLLRSGRQESVKLVFNKIRTKERFAGIIAKQIEVDSASLIKKLYDKKYLKKYNKSVETAMALFIPNTYEFYWNTGIEGFMERMFVEYERFWTNKRLKKAKNLNMLPDEVITLASIVEEETIKNDEKPLVAGVYINRIKKRMRLQADPTVRFAVGDFEIKRILNKHLGVDSPYNTYKYAGLPPGPICIPSISSIDAVLNYKKHSYLYFCAKDDFSGYHAFAKTLRQHNQNAEKYRKALNRNRIYR